jgi:hypothetical protein
MASFSPMSPNPSSAEGRTRAREPQKLPVADAGTGRTSTPPARWEVVLRPFGYLLVAAIWAALFAVTLVLPLLLPFGLRSDNPDYATTGFFDNLDVVVGVLFGVFALLVLVPIFGYIFIALPLASGPLMVLALTYVVRSLRPSYAGTRLSATGWSREAIGPITVFPTALSLIPLRMTGWSRFWLGAALIGWRPSLRLLYAAYAAGLGYFLTVGWVMWPVRSPALFAVWQGVTIAFVVVTLLLIVRDARHRFGSSAGATTRSRSDG